MTILIISTIAMLLVAVSFLVAASWLRRANNRKSAKWSRLERDWGITIEAIAHGVAPQDSLRSRIGAADRMVLLDYLYKRTMHETRPARRELYRTLARPFLSDLERRAKDGDVWQRARAIRTMAELDGADASGLIIRALDDPAPHVAMTAARVYARLRLGPIGPLLDRIASYQVWDRRLLRSLLSSFGPDAAPALHGRVADTSVRPQIRAACAEALGELHYTGANDTALIVLQQEQDVDLVAAILRLVRSDAPRALTEKVRALCSSQDEVVRAQAVSCLSRIGDVADLVLVQSALEDESPWVVLNAGRGLDARDMDRHGPVASTAERLP